MLILSASMGAGHDGAARELARRLDGAGHHAEVRDFLDAGPLRMGTAMRSGYQFELRHAPSAYNATYRFWYRAPWLAPVLACLVSLLTRRRVRRWVSAASADVVVSTYPLATLCLGRMRATRRLTIPAVNFITDFGVHPLWVHKGMDLNLAVQSGPALQAQRRTGKPAMACGPLVADRFDPDLAGTAEHRRQGRQRLGLVDDDLAVLIVAGSWGVGELRETFDSVSRTPGAIPVVVCGRDGALVRQVSAAAAASRAVVLGWTDDMPGLMAASDALVENAGGLTAFEAMRIGLPVITFRPIAGHGVENTEAMAAAGISRMASDPAALDAILRAVGRPGPARDEQIRAARAMFVSDAAQGVLDAIPTCAVPATRRGRQTKVVVIRMATGLVAAAGLTWGGLTTGVGVAAANGTGVAHAQADAGQVIYLGVRLNRAELADPAVSRAVQALGATAVLDDHVASADPSDTRRLADRGVDIANGGQGHRTDQRGQPIRPALWNRAKGDVDAGVGLSEIVGRPVTVLVPGRRVNAFDMVDTGRAHDRLVVPDVVVDVNDADTFPDATKVNAHSIVLVDGLRGTPAEVTASLAWLTAQSKGRGLSVSPMANLR
ncbi:MAG: MGDG synthase family glycosyltransferase [Acidimicrobiales bacterium]